MTLIIPGVEVKVVKEVLAPQLAPSGVLGLVGVAELDDKGAVRGVARAASWRSFIESAGPAAAFAMPEASPALSNGVFELVVSPVTGATAASVKIPASSGTAFTLQARAPGPWANGALVQLVTRSVETEEKDAAGKAVTQLLIDLTISLPGTEYKEVHRNLSVGSAQARNVQKVLAQQSQLLRVVEDADKLKEPKAAAEPASFTLADGKDASAEQYRAALALLENEPDVDMVLVSVQDQSDLTRLARIYSDVIAHCDRMSALSQGRIGLGQVPGVNAAGVKTAAEKLTATLVSDRFVLVAPAGVVGAVAGTLGSLDYFQSPTFKRLAALPEPAPALSVELQQELLKRNVVPVVSQRGRGIIVVRGLTTDGDQISVRRVADHAVRGIKVIGELFIGRLNNEEGRGALKQKLVEFLVQMQKEGAIVPSTDGSDPAFKVNVYSSQDDFAKGIVRVDLAVRPVRAIDYIYATVLVQT
ncbi:phage tail sheath subtilisin-like domain-containing protein [Chitinolyticbacter meiyuanensis]|uniref:phage tail sheath subtilisin-like domain-containing protein n=1 Tax=Chitinolyticbacter meiyuanensis TaxID=682798 RepID=UPI0011E5B430|nr:phage tail sheath subtilisin-like domain-containing protein [Chitinolyticbacter meiyuanensis]